VTLINASIYWLLSALQTYEIIYFLTIWHHMLYRYLRSWTV